MISQATQSGYFAAARNLDTQAQEESDTITRILDTTDHIFAMTQALIQLLSNTEVIDPDKLREGYDRALKQRRLEQAGRTGPLSENVCQISVSKYRITIPIELAKNLVQSVNLDYSAENRSLAIRRSSNGEHVLGQIRSNKSSRVISCEPFIRKNKLPKGHYSAVWSEEANAIIAKIV